jgi:hypothetical protein
MLAKTVPPEARATMGTAAGAFKRWWGLVRSRDPYWDAFLHRPPADPRNVITPAILPGPAGNVFPSQTEVHDPGAMSGHIKELAAFLGADATGISAEPPGEGERRTAAAEDEPPYPFAISCLVTAVEEVREPTGIGGQFALQKCATANFNLAAYIRELGYRASVVADGAHARAAAAGLGALDRDGRLVSHAYGRRVAVAGAILTDLPLVADKAGAV